MEDTERNCKVCGDPMSDHDEMHGMIIDEEGLTPIQVPVVTAMEVGLVGDPETGKFYTLGMRLTTKDGAKREFMFPPHLMLALFDNMHEAVEHLDFETVSAAIKATFE